MNKKISISSKDLNKMIKEATLKTLRTIKLNEGAFDGNYESEESESESGDEFDEPKQAKGQKLGDGLSDDEIMELAKVVVSIYGHGNMIDLDQPKDVCETVKYAMRMEHCNEFEALKYMSGFYGGGWG